MHLESITYMEYEGQDQEWVLQKLRLFDRTLIVGRNASGKSRVLNLINGLAQHLIGVRPPGQEAWIKAEFRDGSDVYMLQLRFKDHAVEEEEVTLNGRQMLKRSADGTATIMYEELDQEISFRSPPGTIATYARRDTLQHPFLEPIGRWAEQLRYYPFAGDLGKHNLAVFTGASIVKPDERNPTLTAGLFKAGVNEFPEVFLEKIKIDMASLDYEVTDVDLGAPLTLRIDGQDVNALRVREAGCKGVYDQFALSNGMYRVLAILININLSLLRNSAATILIDDIGEGLDYERSSKFIRLIREKCVDSNIQLIMSTNDQFVMNAVPLEEWTILHRRGSSVHGVNHENADKVFREFEFTGLSNFNFFELNVEELTHLEN